MTPFRPDHPSAQVRLAPNWNERRNGASPDLLILHYTGMIDGQAAEDWLCVPQSAVSCHYIVHEDGRIVQMVREADRAWHAGAGSWFGRHDVNSFSVGIEIVNAGHDYGSPDFAPAQIASVIALSRDICARWAIPPERVLAHSDIAPGRKIDPGERFPWKRLADAGIGHFVEPVRIRSGPLLRPGEQGSQVAALQEMLANYGYGIEITGEYDAATTAVVEAFQRHFRQERVDGVADSSTVETLQCLHAALAGSGLAGR